MPYRAQYDAAFGGAGDILQRTTLSIVAQALVIYDESPAIPGHAERSVLATQILNDPAGYAARFLYVTALGASTNDAGVDASVLAAWDAMAGV